MFAIIFFHPDTFLVLDLVTHPASIFTCLAYESTVDSGKMSQEGLDVP